MLVYGDHADRVAPAQRLRELADQIAAGPLDQAALTRAFLDLSGVAQGVADADFHACGQDRRRGDESLLLAQLTDFAAALLRSWDRGCRGTERLPELHIPAPLPAEVEVRLPEGYAFYALRPEAYDLAARQLVLSGAPRVIGLRSIGTGLAAMAAAALGAPPPVTLRPVGDSFARELRIDPALERDLLAGDPHYVIVDEGPGLSGSSFGAVADWLEDRGVRPDRIAFLPGHANPLGPRASERHRARWATAQRPVFALDRPDPAAIAALVGPLDHCPRDLGGGAWRPMWSAAESNWPAVNPDWERAKFLAYAGGDDWLVKWAGLGRIGEEKLAMARRLEQVGVGPEVAGLTQGWLITRWYAEARPTRPSLDELTAYLRLRTALPASGPGAPPERLVEMVRRNLPGFANWSPDVSALGLSPVCIDGRMAAHEWLRLPTGRLLKADALDHHRAHDLIGCQDIAWDVAGAIVELDLPDSSGSLLARAFDVPPASLDFHRTAYIGFRVGAHRMSAAALDHWPEEQQRHRAAAERLQAALAPVDAVEHLGHLHQPLGLRVEARA